MAQLDDLSGYDWLIFRIHGKNREDREGDLVC